MSKVHALVDGSIFADSVCKYAVWGAKQLGADIELIHTLSRRLQGELSVDLSGAIGLGARSSLLAELAELDAAASKLSMKRGQAVLELAKAQLLESGFSNVKTHLRHGELAENLTELDTLLLVIGKRGDSAGADTIHLGSNLERVVRSVHKPILVASKEYRPIKRAIFAYDHGVSAKKGLDIICRTPLADRIPIQVLCVTDTNSKLATAAEEASAKLQAAGYPAAVKISAGTLEKVIHSEITEFSADLLLMGAYGHSQIRSLLVGSTTTEMIRSTRLPLLLFR